MTLFNLLLVVVILLDSGILDQGERRWGKILGEMGSWSVGGGN